MEMAKHSSHLLGKKKWNTQQDIPPKPLSFSSSSRIMVGVIRRSLPTFLISLVIKKKGHCQSVIRTHLCLSTQMGTQLRGFCDFFMYTHTNIHNFGRGTAFPMA